MKVVVLAGMGHQGAWSISVSDLGQSATTRPPRRRSPVHRHPPRITPAQAQSAVAAMSSHPGPAGNLTAPEIRKAVEGALDAQLKPVMNLLVETRPSGPSVTEILGGIGYIFGLIGVAAFFSSRRRKLDCWHFNGGKSYDCDLIRILVAIAENEFRLQYFDFLNSGVYKQEMEFCVEFKTR